MQLKICRIVIFQRDVGLIVALGVSASLCLTVIIAKIIGGSMPLLAKKLGFDPAVMAAPIITTIVDALALVVFFNVARLIIGLG